MAKKSRTISRSAVAQRRGRVLELRLTGYPLPQIVEKLQEDPQFKHTTNNTVTNDYNWLNKHASEELVEPNTIIRGVYQDVRNSNRTIVKDSHRKLEEINKEIRNAQCEIEVIDNELSSVPRDDQERRESLEGKRKSLHKLLVSLRSELRDEKRLALLVGESYADLPKKLGIVSEKHDVDVTDLNEQKLVKAIEDEKDPEEQKRLLRMYRTLAKILE